ncbi:MAG: tyrosine-type recombinase/integrase [Candidatus Binataceae bacterium]
MEGSHRTEQDVKLILLRISLSVDFQLHDLRRTAASHMTGIGIPRLVVSKILNHVESGITAVYDRHSYDAEKCAALLKWARHLTRMNAMAAPRMSYPLRPACGAI